MSDSTTPPPAGGLGRFVKPAAAPEPAPAAEQAIPAALQKILNPAPKPPPGEVCEMCNERIPEEHQHVVNIDSRALLCTCRPCYLLFTVQGAAGGKYVSVPDRYIHDPEIVVSDAQWDQFQIPVKMAFFFVNSAMNQTVAFYPSPAGATESLLPSETWAEIMEANPLFSSLAPDVEALLFYKGDAGFECFLAPIDTCYELVGTVRMFWKGFDGGQEAWEAIDTFFDKLRDRSRPGVMR